MSRAIQALAIVLAMVVWSMNATASPKGEPPIEGWNYRVVDCPYGHSGTCVRILPGNSPRNNIDTRAFADVFNTSVQSIRAENPTSTIPLCCEGGSYPCRASKARGMVRRTTQEHWLSCPNEQEQHAYLVPGATIFMSGTPRLSFNQKVQVIERLEKCEDAYSCMAITKEISPNAKGWDRLYLLGDQPIEVKPEKAPPQSYVAPPENPAFDAEKRALENALMRVRVIAIVLALLLILVVVLWVRQRVIQSRDLSEEMRFSAETRAQKGQLEARLAESQRLFKSLVGRCHAALNTARESDDPEVGIDDVRRLDREFSALDGTRKSLVEKLNVPNRLTLAQLLSASGEALDRVRRNHGDLVQKNEALGHEKDDAIASLSRGYQDQINALNRDHQERVNALAEEKLELAARLDDALRSMKALSRRLVGSVPPEGMPTDEIAATIENVGRDVSIALNELYELATGEQLSQSNGVLDPEVIRTMTAVLIRVSEELAPYGKVPLPASVPERVRGLIANREETLASYREQVTAALGRVAQLKDQLRAAGMEPPVSTRESAPTGISKSEALRTTATLRPPSLVPPPANPPPLNGGSGLPRGP